MTLTVKNCYHTVVKFSTPTTMLIRRRHFLSFPITECGLALPYRQNFALKDEVSTEPLLLPPLSTTR
jgi:hypothetical protein